MVKSINPTLNWQKSSCCWLVLNLLWNASCEVVHSDACACTVKYEFVSPSECFSPLQKCVKQHQSSSYSPHTCRLPAPVLLCVCDRDVECVCATLLRPIWRALNLYRFPFPGLCFPSLELRHAAMQPPPSSPCNTISPINSSPFKTPGEGLTNAPCCRPPRLGSSGQQSNGDVTIGAALFL